jgi:hypothetical protein
MIGAIFALPQFTPFLDDEAVNASEGTASH